MTIKIEQPNVLIGEGREDEQFFRAFIDHLGLHKIQVLPIGGKTQLRQNLKALTLSPSFTDVKSLGITRDANNDPSAAFQSIRDALSDLKLPVPNSPLVPVGNQPRVAVMILPKKNQPGMLEDLCLKSVENTVTTLCVNQYFDCLQKQKIPLPLNMSKAKTQVFIASKPKAGLRLGEAAQAGYWPWDNQAFDQLKKFLELLIKY